MRESRRRCDEDLYLDRRRHRALRREQHARCRAATTSTRRASCRNGQIFAETGNVTLRVGDNVATAPEQPRSLADAEHRHLRRLRRRADPDPGYGTNMILRGRIIADCSASPRRPASGDPIGTARRRRRPRRSDAHADLGQQRHRHVPVRRPVGHRRRAGDGPRWARGYIFLGSKTMVYGTHPRRSTTATGDADLSTASTDDGEDRFIVYYLQSTNVVDRDRPGRRPRRRATR